MVRIKANMVIPTDIKKISKLFHDAGKELFVVGGAVRDFLQGKQPHDYDLVTNALPHESTTILKGWNVSDEQGKNFGVLRIYTKDEPLGYELAVYRKDISHGRDTKGDDKKVEIGNHITIEDDCKRRDLTFNALFYDITKQEIIDLVGGINDIKNNIVRCVGNPSERFNEDRLRICRCLRFSARTGGIIDKETSNAIKADNRLRGIGSADDVSQERIVDEWNKVIEHAKKGGIKIMQSYVDMLTEFGMWEQMFPNMRTTSKITITSLENAIILLDVFKTEIIKSQKGKLNQLKISNNTINQMVFLQEFVLSNNDSKDVYKLANLKERFHIDDLLLVDFTTHINIIYGSETLSTTFTTAFLKYCNDGFVINGEQLILDGFKGFNIQVEKERLENERFQNNYISFHS